MVNPGAFRGLRKEFLMNEKQRYREGVAGGFAADALAVIYKRFFLRFPVDLSHDEDPTADVLARVNDSAPMPEPEEPDSEKLSTEEYAAAMEKMEERRKIINFRKAQIKRWMAYQYMKDHDINAMDSGLDNPYRLILHKLTGVAIQRPRQRSAVNTWRKTVRDSIEQEVKILTKKAGGVHRDKLAAFRDKVAKTMFSKLPKEEQAQWELQAKEDHQEKLAEWKRELESPPSTDPAARQKCFQAMPAFAQLFLDAICEATGCKATLLVGGPEPAHNGRLNIISVHSGTTPGDVRMTFGRLERARYTKYFIPVFGSFLQACYSPEECRARALPSEDGFEPLQAADLERDGFNLDTFDNGEALPTDAPVTTPSSSTPLSVAPPETSTPETTPTTPGSPAPSGAENNPPTVHVHAPPEPSTPETTPAAAGSPAPSGVENNPPAVPVQVPEPHPHSLPVPSIGMSPRNRSPSVAPSPGPSPQRPPKTRSPPLAPSAVHSPRTSPGVENPTLGLVAGRPSEDQNTGSSQLGQKRRSDEAAMPNKQVKRPRMAATDKDPTSAPAKQNPLNKVASKSRSLAARPSNRPLSAPAANPTSATVTPSASATSRANPLPPSTPTTSSATPTPHVVASSGAPKWFSDALVMLLSEDLGERWADLIRIWAEFEEKHGYKEIAVLKATSRPTAVKDWIARARPTTYCPAIADLKKYEKDFNTWWAALQPSWRRLPNGAVSFDLFDGSWEALEKPGINGLFSVLAALFFWGVKVAKSQGDSKWLDAVKDLESVLTSISRP